MADRIFAQTAHDEREPPPPADMTRAGATGETRPTAPAPPERLGQLQFGVSKPMKMIPTTGRCQSGDAGGVATRYAHAQAAARGYGIINRRGHQGKTVTEERANDHE
jgi:hypothetical protein